MAKFCGKCGAVLDEVTGTCPNCDPQYAQQVYAYPEDAQDAYYPDQTYASTPKSRSGVKVILALLLVVVLAVGTLTALAYFDVAYIPVISDFLDDLEKDETGSPKKKEEKETAGSDFGFGYDREPQSAAADPDYRPTDPMTTTTTAPDQNVRADADQTIPIFNVSCSSDQGSGKYERSFGPEMAIDGDFNTCWMVAGDVAGRDNWIEFDLGSAKTVSGVKLLNGNGWDGYYNGEKVEDGLFDLNGRIKDFELTFSDGTSRRYTAADVREESYGSNIFYFDQPVTTRYIRLYIESGYEGSKWTTVACLSEFAVF